MGYLKYVKKAWEQPRKNLGEAYKQKLVQWRRENSIERIEHPTRPDRAKALGFKAKQGFVVARSRVIRGGKQNASIRKGRDGGNLSSRLEQGKNYQWIAEEKVQRKFPNLEVVNSYWVGKDEKYAWYEVILVDVYHPQIYSDKQISWIVANNHTRRAQRGLTSAGRKARGLRNKGIGAEKVRPSMKSNNNKLR